MLHVTCYAYPPASRVVHAIYVSVRSSARDLNQSFNVLAAAINFNLSLSQCLAAGYISRPFNPSQFRVQSCSVAVVRD